MQAYLHAVQYFWKRQYALRAIQFSNRKLDLFWLIRITHQNNRRPKQKMMEINLNSSLYISHLIPFCQFVYSFVEKISILPFALT